MEIALIVFWLACGGFAYIVAQSKNRSGCAWGLLGFLFGPLALLAVGFMPPVETSTGASAGGKVCPHCHVRNSRYATSCNVCGRPFED